MPAAAEAAAVVVVVLVHGQVAPALMTAAGEGVGGGGGAAPATVADLHVQLPERVPEWPGDARPVPAGCWRELLEGEGVAGVHRAAPVPCARQCPPTV